MDKKLELQKIINDENGINYHRNVSLNGYTVYKKESFISFHFMDVNGVTTVLIDYIFVTCKKDLIKLLSFCINFWAGHAVKFIYLKEHRRKANYVEKYFKSLGFTILSSKTKWKHDWTCTNGYDKDEVLEAYL